MNRITKADALSIIRRAYGPLQAESLADRLPDRIDFDNEADIELLSSSDSPGTACSMRSVGNSESRDIFTRCPVVLVRRPWA